MSVNTINAQIDSLKKHQKADEKKLRQAREDALQQAWLVNQQQTRMLPQQLSAQGTNGGAVQSSIVSMNNEYQRNRRRGESDYSNQLAESRLKYGDKFAQLQAQLADAQEAAARAAASRRGYGWRPTTTSTLGTPTNPYYNNPLQSAMDNTKKRTAAINSGYDMVGGVGRNRFTW